MKTLHNIKIYIFITALSMMLCSCGGDNSIKQFRAELEDFCDNIVKIDSNINKIDTDSDDYISKLLKSLNELDEEFQKFSAIDFPEQFDYLELTADEAAEYMTEAVNSFRDAYTNEEYTADMFNAKYEYAKENYARAYKRLQIIISLIHGEKPDDVTLK